MPLVSVVPRFRAGKSGVCGGCCTNSIGIHPNSIAIEPESEIGDERGTQSEGSAQSEALIASRCGTCEVDAVEGGSASFRPVGARGEMIEVSESVSAEEMEAVREGVVDSSIELVTVEALTSSRDVVI